MQIRDLTMSEADYLQTVCNFTRDENTLFELRLQDKTLDECAEAMNTSVPTISRLHKRVLDKIENVVNNGTRDILENANSNTRAILDFLTQDKIATLTAENQSLKFQASQTAQNAFITANQQAQTAELIRRLGADCPTPAYVVQPPTPVHFPYSGCGNGAYGYTG